MRLEDHQLRYFVRRLLIEALDSAEEQKKQDSKVSASVIFRRAVGLAISDSSNGKFVFNPPASGPTSTSGIRINPSSADIGDPIKSLLETLIQAKFVPEGTDELAKITAGDTGSKSGKFPTFPISIDPSWFDAPNSYIDQAIQSADISDKRKEYLRNEIFSGDNRRSPVKISAVNVVLRAKSLESRLFTGQGLGELAEYAVSAAINGTSQFQNAIKTAILAPSWKNADQGMRSRFEAIYDDMVGIAESNMKKAVSSTRSKSVKSLFGDSSSVEGAGGGRFDVVTSNARIHVKFDIGGSMTRLAGIKPEYEDDFDKAEAIDNQLDDIAFGESTYYWKYIRSKFKENFGLDVDNPKDKEALRDAKFYEWMLGIKAFDPLGTDITVQNEYTDEQISWLNSERPNFKQLLLTDIRREFIDDPLQDDRAIKYFYFTFYPDKNYKINKLKIEQLGISDIPLQGLDIVMNPTYLSKNQIGSPYILVDGAGNVLMELEFRAKGTSKPIQMHRGPDFSKTIDSGEASLSTVIAENSLRKVIRLSLIKEALTNSDKKEIERLAKKQAKAIFDKEFSSAIEKELKKRNGIFDKKTNDAITNRFKNAKSDKDFDDAVIKVSKRVMKALHDLHYKRNALIDSMPVPKS